MSSSPPLLINAFDNEKQGFCAALRPARSLSSPATRRTIDITTAHLSCSSISVQRLGQSDPPATRSGKLCYTLSQQMTQSGCANKADGHMEILPFSCQHPDPGPGPGLFYPSVLAERTAQLADPVALHGGDRPVQHPGGRCLPLVHAQAPGRTSSAGGQAAAPGHFHFTPGRLRDHLLAFQSSKTARIRIVRPCHGFWGGVLVTRAAGWVAQASGNGWPGWRPSSRWAASPSFFSRDQGQNAQYLLLIVLAFLSTRIRSNGP